MSQQIYYKVLPPFNCLFLKQRRFICLFLSPNYRTKIHIFLSLFELYSHHSVTLSTGVEVMVADKRRVFQYRMISDIRP